MDTAPTHDEQTRDERLLRDSPGRAIVGLAVPMALASLLEQDNPPQQILITPFDPTNGTHAGPGSLALFFEGDEDVRLH